ncbi:MAG: large subunit ribosomal protein L20 [Parcubacteria group bacterium Athens0714_16]|nr:MAG: large subunit ribosomal protein L20 [Parcubacteria group bacterium Athens0714_16]
MTRVKRGTISLKRRKNVLKMTKGYRFGRSTKERQAREAIAHAGVHAFNDRRNKKGNFRRDWTNTINYAVRELELTYSKFIKLLKDKKIELDRKVLAQIAIENPESFNRIVEQTKK